MSDLLMFIDGPGFCVQQESPVSTFEIITITNQGWTLYAHDNAICYCGVTA